MVGKEKGKKIEFDAVRDIVDSFGGVAYQVLDLLVVMERRLSDVEAEVVALSGRLDRAELRAGVATSKLIAAGTFMNIPDLEEVST
jgi:hypothetical protein